MLSSTARKIDLDASASWDQVASGVGRVSKNADGDKFSPVTITSTPHPSSERMHQAMGSRIVGRRSAALTTDFEKQELLSERALLIKKLIAGNISRPEKSRLEYVRWSLDRIEDAQHGHSLDALESAVDLYQSFAHKVDALRRGLEKAAG